MAKMVRAQPVRSIVPIVLGLTLLLLLAGMGSVVWFDLAAEPAPPVTHAEAEPVTASGGHTAGGEPEDATAARAKTGTPVEAVADAMPACPPGCIRVRVLLAATLEPVALAEVAADPAERERPLKPEVRAELETDPDPFRRCATLGQVTTADAHGWAVIATHGQGSFQVCARKGDLYGHLQLELEAVNGDAVPLLLEPDQTTTVHVVDQRDQPVAGAALRIIQRRQLPGAAVVDENGHPAGTSDAQGTCMLRHLQLLRQRPGWGDLAVGLMGPGLDQARVPLPSDAKEVRLVVPATGGLRVHFTAPDGKPLGDLPEWTVTLRDRGAGGYMQRIGRDGVVEFAAVGLGRQLDVQFTSDSIRMVRTLAGPAVPGQWAEHTLSLRDLRLVEMSGRLVDEAGAPHARRNITLQLNNQTHLASSTDDEGRFRFRAMANENGRRPSGEYQALQKVGTLRITVVGGRIPDGTSAELPWPGGTRDLGDVVVKNLPVIARGVVVAAAGVRPPDLALFVHVANGDSWNGAEDAWVALGDGDTFTVHSLSADPAVQRRVCAVGTGIDSECVAPFRVGQEDVRLELKSGHVFTARVLVDADVANFRIGAFLRGHVGEEEQSFQCSGVRVAAGEWTLSTRSAPAGTYDLEVVHMDDDVDYPVLGRLEGVVVGSSQPDRRLDPIDLRGRFGPLGVRLVDDNAAVIDLSFTLDRLVEGRWRWSADGHHGAAMHMAPFGVHEIMIHADGYQTRRLQAAVGTPMDVAMHPAATVVVTFANMPKLPPDVPLGYDLDAPETFWTNRGSGNWPVQETQRQPGSVEFRVAEATDSTLYVAINDERIASLPIHFDPQTPKVTLTLPPEAVEKLQRLVPAGK